MVLQNEDDVLIHRFLNGDEEALGQLYDRYSQQIYNFLLGFVDFHGAEDVLQETFLKITTNLPSYRNQGRFIHWVFTIAKRSVIDHLRKNKRHRVRFVATAEMEFIEGRQMSAESSHTQKELAVRMKESIHSLPEIQRTVFLLREEAGLTFKEIASTLQLPLNTALSHMHRAMSNLREMLADLDDAHSET